MCGNISIIDGTSLGTIFIRPHSSRASPYHAMINIGGNLLIFASETARRINTEAKARLAGGNVTLLNR
jgi:hypothetical protein